MSLNILVRISLVVVVDISRTYCGCAASSELRGDRYVLSEIISDREEVRRRLHENEAPSAAAESEGSHDLAISEGGHELELHDSKAEEKHEEGKHEEHEGHEHESEEEKLEREEMEVEFGQRDLSEALMLLGGICFVMALFYLVNHEDEDMKFYSWNVISTTISIFVSVFMFSSINLMINQILLAGQSEWVIAGGAFGQMMC
eukprot:gnl/MRDRNA2_/MRDRNA2_64986_c0_seq2.p1 gnl/MRDRNA2_/MRDRNA2_64986_c0~~gnl/MRDRNA2_/MRDRNA2_64986_c0_seq2.p1  ORF type:complete len:202 (+),score=36.29 gnl/MRDRNA2_/MRDRNA2_64986_c0_seq2:91-696(+)